MKVVCLVLNWNGAKYIGDTLTSLLQVDHPDCEYEVVVIDNDSTDNSVTLISDKYPKIKLLQNPTNMGYAAGNNQGINYALSAGADFVWVVNSDITVDRTILTRFLEGATKYKTAGIFGCKIYFAPGFEYHKERYSAAEHGKVIWYAGGIIDWKNVIASHRGVDQVDRGQYDIDLEVDFVTGAVMFLRRSVLERVGAFDPNYAFYYEENDLCQRAYHRGFKLMYLGLANAWHANAQSTGMGSPLQDYFISRNRLLFGMKYAPLRAKLALFRQSRRLLASGRPWEQRGISDFYKRSFGFGSFEIT